VTTWVLLRGLAREARHWGAFPALLQQRLPAGDRVIAPDLPGNGALWREPSPRTIAGMVQALRAPLQREAGGPYVLVALSLGGMVALEWACRAPHEVRGCVLVNSSVGRFSPPWQRLRAANWLPLLCCALPLAPQRRERTVWRMTSNRGEDAALMQEWVEIARAHPVGARSLVRQLAAAAVFRAPARLDVPMLVIASRGDRLVAPQCSAAMARAWGLPLVEHATAGHDLPLDDAPWLADAIGHWARQRVA
jgi:pimeloyl-ACP methyl ester carboxylesterase